MTTTKQYLDDETIATLKSTVSFLAQNGTTITQLFYKKLFESHPELKNIFNLSHQEDGDQQQALAKAVYGFANNLDNLDAFADEISRIAHKHTSLNVQPEHYPIVGENLLLAIHEIVTKEVNKEAADTITEAWGKGYGVLADLLMNFEKKLYDTSENQMSGWKGLRQFALIKKEKESEGIISFYIKPTDNKALPIYQAGQYISVYVKADGWDYQQIRQYSLSDAHRDDCYRFTVKKEGLVSQFLHDQWKVGDVINITPPAGDFFLQENTENPIVLLGAGVGVTPMISLLNSVLEKRMDQKVILAHAVKNSKQHAFKQFIHDTTHKYAQRFEAITFYEKPLETDQLAKDYDHQGLMDLEIINESVKQENANYYLCGPKPFMASLHKTLSSWGISKSNIHYEVFGSDKALY